ncbi:unnamed protein product [Protopolystoma xenopodis]|uniref:Uncharacterized protein n=1 Tax=Protopolystoma xenopodis TaxID=117903 RepID=A0A3S4ZIM8_9PLAT|nr:unnamed protein product [Protopolystoma xenopodis]
MGGRSQFGRSTPRSWRLSSASSTTRPSGPSREFASASVSAFPRQVKSPEGMVCLDGSAGSGCKAPPPGAAAQDCLVEGGLYDVSGRLCSWLVQYVCVTSVSGVSGRASGASVIYAVHPTGMTCPIGVAGMMDLACVADMYEVASVKDGNGVIDMT